MDINKLKSVVRRLTPVETSRLMGFPDDYLDIGDGKGGATPDSPMYKACGNSWGVNCARWVNLRIEKVLRETGIVKDRTIRYATTCSGVEAHSLSVRGLDWQPYFFSEIEPFPCRVLATRYPNVPNLGDMTKVDGKQYPLDVFSGGTPCQSFSVAGKRHGLGGATSWEDSETRSSLAFHWVRIGLETGAPVLLWENVPGVYSSTEGKDFPWLLHFLNDHGYSVAWRTLDVQWTATDEYPLAIPQRRRRCWLVAFKGKDWRIPAKILWERSDRTGKFAPYRIVNGQIVKKGEDEPKPVEFFQPDLFGFYEPTAPQFDHNSRADEIPWMEFPAAYANASLEALAIARKCGTIGYAGNIFEGGVTDTDHISERLRTNIGNAGLCVGDYIITMKCPEWSAGIQIHDGADCPAAYEGYVNGLTDILVTMEKDEDFDYLMKYFLSARACTGILRRANKRGKKLPEDLVRGLDYQIAGWANGLFGDCVKADAETEEAEAEGEGDGSSTEGENGDGEQE